MNNEEFIIKTMLVVSDKHSLELEETAKHLLNLLNILPKHNVTHVINKIYHCGEEGKILSKAMSEMHDLAD